MRTIPFSLKLGAVLTIAFIAVAVFAPLVAPVGPLEQNLYEGLNGPDASHLLGQDRLGRDILSRIIYGSRVSLLVGFVTVSISFVIGTLLGATAGYIGGKVDSFVMRLCDVFFAFPGILLAISVMAILGPSLTNQVLHGSPAGRCYRSGNVNML